MNLEKLGVQELDTQEISFIEGGNWITDVMDTVIGVQGAVIGVSVAANVELAKFGLGVLAGIADGITAGMED